MGVADQAPYDVRFDWGLSGLGRLLGERGFSADLRFAAELDVSGAAPELRRGAFTLAEDS